MGVFPDVRHSSLLIILPERHDRVNELKAKPFNLLKKS